MALEILFNTAQTRLGLDRIPLIAKGGEMELDLLRSGAWIEPTNDRILLEPYCLTDTWVTSNSGNYAKLALSDFTATGTWETRVQTGFTAGPWLGIADTAGSGSLVTTTTYAKNRGFWVGAFVYSLTDNTEILRCGWNSSASLAAGVGLSIWSNGRVIVYKDGAKVAEGSVKIQKNKPLELTLIPYAHRELLIHCLDGDKTTAQSPIRRGSGFSAVFTDIATDASDPTITPASKFWIEVPSGGTQVMAAPLLFPTSGYVTSVPQSFIEAPAVTDVLEEALNDSWIGAGPTYPYLIYGHPAYVSTQSASAVAVDWSGAAFTANGTNIECRLKVTLTTASANVTPTVYGAQLAYSATFATTDATEEYDATAHCLSASLSVPEDASGVSLTLRFRDPLALEADIPNFRRATNYPVKLILDDITVIDGRAETPNWTRMPTDPASTVEIEVRDGMKGAEGYRFAEATPLDKFSLEGALGYLAGHCGIAAANQVISTSGFDLPMETRGVVDGWSVLIEVGDTPADWMRRLVEDFAATWLYGIRPSATVVKFFASDPTTIGTTALVTLWRSDTDSADVSKGNHATDPWKWVYHLGSQVETLEPEATEVRVSGWDTRTGRLIQAYKIDTAAEDATTAPSSRPANWVGEKRRYGLMSELITTQASANAACEIIYDRITPVREIVEWESYILTNPSNDVPAWRGDVVRLEGMGYYKIISFAWDIELDDSVITRIWGRYVGEKVAGEPS